MATAALVSVLACCLVGPALSTAAPVNGGALSSGHAVEGEVSETEGIAYTFTAVAGQHVTLALTNPHNVSPVGSNLVMRVYDASKGEDASGRVFSTSGTEIDFTPTKEQAGPTTVVISDYENHTTTGNFTLTYATDVTGTLTSGVSTGGAVDFAGQHADYSFTAVAGQPQTISISNPSVSPLGTNLVLRVYDASGGEDGSARAFSASGTNVEFTPSKEQAGPTTAVVSYFENAETTGSFTLTLTNGSLLLGGPGPPLRRDRAPLRDRGKRARARRRSLPRWVCRRRSSATAGATSRSIFASRTGTRGSSRRRCFSVAGTSARSGKRA